MTARRLVVSADQNKSRLIGGVNLADDATEDEIRQAVANHAIARLPELTRDGFYVVNLGDAAFFTPEYRARRRTP